MGLEYLRESFISGIVPSLGQLIFFDDFSYSYNWTMDGSYGDRELNHRVLTPRLNSPTSLYLQTETTAPAVDEYIELVKQIPILANLRAQYECVFLPPDISRCKYLTFTLQHTDGAFNNISEIRYDVANTIWQYLDFDNTPQNISTLNREIGDNSWNRLKFSIDFFSYSYISVSINSLSASLSGILYRRPSLISVPLSQTKINITTSGSNACDLNVDSILVRKI